MKKIVLGFMAIAISFAAVAQTEEAKSGKRKEGGKEFRHKGDRTMTELNLSETQKAQIKTINENFRSQIASLGSNKSVATEAQKEKRDMLRKEHKAQIMAVLTPEQKKQWEEKKKQHYFKGKNGREADKKQPAL